MSICLVTFVCFLCFFTPLMRDYFSPTLIEMTFVLLPWSTVDNGHFKTVFILFYFCSSWRIWVQEYWLSWELTTFFRLFAAASWTIWIAGCKNLSHTNNVEKVGSLCSPSVSVLWTGTLMWIVFPSFADTLSLRPVRGCRRDGASTLWVQVLKWSRAIFFQTIYSVALSV